MGIGLTFALNFAQMKSGFATTARVRAALAPAELDYLGHAGAHVRLAARHSMRLVKDRSISSPPGTPLPPASVIVVPDGKQIIVDTDEVQPNPGDFKIAST